MPSLLILQQHLSGQTSPTWSKEAGEPGRSLGLCVLPKFEQCTAYSVVPEGCARMDPKDPMLCLMHIFNNPTLTGTQMAVRLILSELTD